MGVLPKRRKPMTNHIHKNLVQILLNCAWSCEVCAVACLNESDVTAMAACIRLNRDCADMCGQAAVLLERNSKIGNQFLLLCEEICLMCKDECEKHGDMDHCRQCAEACRKCAEACHEHHEPITQK